MPLLALIRMCIALLGAAVGAVLIAMGIGYYKGGSDLVGIFKDAGIPQPVNAVLILGVVIFVMSVISLLSAIRNTILGTIIYCSILGLIISFLIVIAIMIFVKHHELLEESGEMFDSIWKNREKSNNANFLDKVNQYFRCCGSKSPADYVDIMPPSCCDQPINSVCAPASVYQNGCRKEVINYTGSKADLIGSIAIVTAVVLSVVVISSFI